MRIKSLKSLRNLTGKTVFLRVDFNVPLHRGRVLEDYRLVAGLETIRFLLAQRCRLIIATHLGDPAGRKQAACSVRPVAARLAKLLKKPVKFCPDVSGPTALAAVKKMKPGQIVMIENLRFRAGEYSNDKAFAQELAVLADIYVNDAFAVCHRDQASVSAIKKFLPSYSGLLLEKELRALERVKNPKKPLVVIMGGAKISTKAPLIRRLRPKASHILLGGALANNFFKFQGLGIGRSLFDKDSTEHIRPFFQTRRLDRKIIIPVDVVVSGRDGRPRLCRPDKVKREEMILDIGPETISLFASYIKKANTLVWNGPLGKFETEGFKQGTLSVAKLVAARSSGPAFGLVGGGETVEALERSRMAEYVDWVSTAGGAMLAYLGGAKMPGLKDIVIK